MKLEADVFFDPYFRKAIISKDIYQADKNLDDPLNFQALENAGR